MSQADHSLFIYRSGIIFIVLLIYVDDILVTGNDVVKIRALVDSLHSKFHMKDLGSVNYFLGIEINKKGTGMLITQTNYALNLLKRTGFVDSKPLATPVAAG